MDVLAPDVLPAEAAAPGGLDLLVRLAAALDGERVSYCYWRSAGRLSRAMRGEGDLDLLFARRDWRRAMLRLLSLGFKPFPSIGLRAHPAIFSFLGYDEPSGLIVHVHAHTALVFGGALSKDHLLPLAAGVLARAVPDALYGIPVLDPVDEALLLVLRACLDRPPLDPVAWRNRAALSRKHAEGVAALSGKVAAAALRARAEERLGTRAARLIEASWPDEGGARRRTTTSRQLRRSLSDFRIYGPLEAALRSVPRSANWVFGALNARRLHLPRPWNRTAPSGGCVVALVGVDGSGKTSVLAALRGWLGPEIDMVPMYFGTGGGRPSLLLLPLKLLAPLYVRFRRSRLRGASHSGPSEPGASVADAPAAGRVHGLLLMVWAAVLAVEKRRKLRAAHRGASRGLVVVADRFVQDQLQDFNDGPLLHRIDRCPRWLDRFERQSYALGRRLAPDLVIKLVASPETLSRREPSMDPALVRERATMLSALTFPGARVVSVDAERPLPEVVRAVKNEVWSML